MKIARNKELLSCEYFSVDGTLIQAWAGHNSFVGKDSDGQNNKGGDSEADIKCGEGSNETRQSKADPGARLNRKGKTASELRCMCHTLSDNSHGLIVNARVTRADGHAEREVAKAMLNDARHAIDDDRIEITVSVDKGYDAREACRRWNSSKVCGP